jgi:hypothetical protein
MSAKLQNFLLALLLAFLLITGYVGWIRLGEKDVGALSMLAAAGCAFAALWVSWQGNMQQNKHRNEDRKAAARAAIEEKVAADAKHLKTRVVIASVYATEIGMWLHRKELQDLRTSVVRIARVIEFQAPLLNLQLSARESIKSISGESELPAELVRGLERVRDEFRRELAMPAVRAIPRIPNIWSTQFRREDVDALGSDALRYFLGMSTLWSNLVHAAQQFPSVDEVLMFTEQHRVGDVAKYLKLISDYIAEFKTIFESFLSAACQGESSLLGYALPTAPPSLPAIDSVLLQSQRISLNIVGLLQWISVERAMDALKSAPPRFPGALAAAEKSLRDAEVYFQGVHKIAERSLAELERTAPTVMAEPSPTSEPPSE